MILGLEIGMLIAGILALVRGRVAWGKARAVTGPAARVIGVVLLLPIPLAFAVGFAIGFESGLRGQQLSAADKEFITLTEVVITVACLLVALAISGVTSKPTTEAEPPAAEPVAAPVWREPPREPARPAEFADNDPVFPQHVRAQGPPAASPPRHAWPPAPPKRSASPMLIGVAVGLGVLGVGGAGGVHRREGAGAGLRRQRARGELRAERRA